MAEEKRQEEQKFDFMKEKIKKQPIYQNRHVRRAVFTFAMAVMFGVVACFAFVLVRPWMERTFGKDEVSAISIPREDDEEGSGGELPDAEDAGETGADTGDGEFQKPVVTEPAELEAEDYVKLYGKLKTVAEESTASLVTVTAASSDTDWFNETYESSRQISGLLVGNNGAELLVLTPYSAIRQADSLKVTFVNDTEVSAVLKNYDIVTDLAILSVNLADVDSVTIDKIRMAELGSSRTLKAGDVVIAVGSPAGLSGSVIYGNLTSSAYTASVIDGEYRLLLTDIERSENASGVLINISGQVIGLIESRYLNSNNEQALTAYAISDMKDVIEHLSNSQDLVYMGITGIQVSSTAASEQDIPQGVYVSSVALESPAMNAGIQTGDILVDINGNKITSMRDIQELLLKFSKDQIIRVTIMRQGREEYKSIACSVTLDVQR